jgi:hypothetical protein
MATKKAAKPSGPQKVSFKLTAANKVKAAACIKKSGKVSIGIKQISVTKLPASHSSIIIID